MCIIIIIEQYQPGLQRGVIPCEGLLSSFLRWRISSEYLHHQSWYRKELQKLLIFREEGIVHFVQTKTALTLFNAVVF